MAIIIDGWNFIRHPYSDIGGHDSLEAARILISRLQAFQLTHRDPIVLVFDSSREFLDLRYTNSASLTVIAARDTDDYIRKYIDRIPPRQRRNIRVVSSDRGIYDYAKSNSATAIKCDDFWDKIEN